MQHKLPSWAYSLSFTALLLLSFYGGMKTANAQGGTIPPGTIPAYAAAAIPTTTYPISLTAANTMSVEATCGFATNNDGFNINTMRVGDTSGSYLTWAPHTAGCPLTLTLTLTGTSVGLRDIYATFNAHQYCVRNQQNTWYRCVVPSDGTTIHDIWPEWVGLRQGYMEIEQRFWNTSGDDARLVFTGTVQAGTTPRNQRLFLPAVRR